EPGRGSVFWFVVELPAAGGESAAAPDLAGLKLLSATANPVGRRVLARQLASAGAAVETATREEALARLGEAALAGAPFDAAILDADDELEGFAQRVREDAALAGLKLVVALTAEERGRIDRYRSAGFDAYLMKPV